MMRSVLVGLTAGVIFAVGLATSGMTDPARVEAFLDVGGDWDPSLALVMGGAIAVHALAWAWQRRLPGPLGRPRGWTFAPLHGVDARLVLGAALFGIGWGVSGWCPGPALVSLPTLGAEVLTFVGAMIVGLAIGGVARRPRRSVGASEVVVPDEMCG